MSDFDDLAVSFITAAGGGALFPLDSANGGADISGEDHSASAVGGGSIGGASGGPVTGTDGTCTALVYSSNQRIQTDYNPFQNDAARTFGWWSLLDDFHGNDRCCLSDQAGKVYFDCRTGGNYPLINLDRDAGSYAGWDGGGASDAFELDVWHLNVVTISAGTGANRVLNMFDSYSSIAGWSNHGGNPWTDAEPWNAATQDLCWGDLGNLGAGVAWSGKVSRLFVVEAELSLDDVIQLYNYGSFGAPPPPPPPPPVPATLPSAVQRSHVAFSTATLLRAGADPLVLPGLVDGGVTMDSRAATQRQCDLSFFDDGTLGLIPESPSSLLVPYGQEIQLRRGVRLPDGSELESSLGIFRIQDTNVDEGGDGVNIRVTGFDRSLRVSEAKFVGSDIQVAGGTDFLTAVQTVIEGGLPSVEFDVQTDFTGQTPLVSFEEGGDRWKAAQDMAAAMGLEIFFNDEGLCAIRMIPDITGNPVAELVEGDGGLLTRAAPDWTREGGFNAVIYTGESTDVDGAVPRGDAYDDNPDSPTYYYGAGPQAFGQVPVFENSSWLTTNEQCDQAAEGKLKKEMGTARSIDFGSIVYPTLRPGDIIRIKRERLHVDENHIIDSLTIPLGPGEPMTGKTRVTLVQ